MKNKWMSKEEFEGEYSGWCWVAISGDYVDSAYYYNENYYQSPNSYSIHDVREIKAVMPIEKPEYPKEVG